jgi:hypothetical protein
MFDWKSQEYGIWAGLSEDERQIEDCCSGDPYMAFARNAACRVISGCAIATRSSA